MPAFVINQESMLSLWARTLGVNRHDLSEDDLRFGLALYHGGYLPIAMLMEVRANELDITALYQALGFTPNVPSVATATLVVNTVNAPTSTPYHLKAPFAVTQDGKEFMATTDLTIPVGQNSGSVTIVAQTQGAIGTPTEGFARITPSVGWLLGASIVITAVTPGIDGDDRATMAAQVREFVANPEALVRADDHANWLMRNNSRVSRAIASARTEVTYDGSWMKGPGEAGHLMVAALDESGGVPSPELLGEIKDQLLVETIPYGPDALHVVPIHIQNISGQITVKATPSVDHEVLIESIISRLDTLLSWRNWPQDKHVYAGEIWSSLAGLNGVSHVQLVELDGRTLPSAPSTSVFELQPWELPRSGFNAGMVTIE